MLRFAKISQEPEKFFLFTVLTIEQFTLLSEKIEPLWGGGRENAIIKKSGRTISKTCQEDIEEALSWQRRNATR
ncbi:MAG: hypothetical protein ACK41Q_12475 [Candidatus Brocadia sp.]